MMHINLKSKKINWIKWNVLNATPFDANDLPADQRVKGTGNGELKLVNDVGAPFFGGRLMGGYTAYDIVLADGKKYEVKEIKTDREEMRIGTEGSVFISRLKRKLDITVDQILDFIHEAPTSKEHDNIAIHITSMKKFLDKMEYSRGLMLGGTTKNKIGFYQICQTLNKIVKSYSGCKFIDVPQLGIPIPAVEFAIFARKYSIEPEVLGVTRMEMAKHLLSHEYFENPESFKSDWDNVAKPSSLFPDIEGVVVVNKEKGYSIIRKECFDTSLEFVRITKGSVKIRIQI